MTLIVGFKCYNGIILAADNCELQSVGMIPLATYKAHNKIIKVGKDCAIAFAGQPEAAWTQIVGILDTYGESDEIDCLELSKRLSSEVDIEINVSVSFIIGGYRYIKDGRKLTICKASIGKNDTTIIDSMFVSDGVDYCCDYFRNFIPIDEVKTLDHAKKTSAIIMRLIGKINNLVIGELGCIAEITDNKCILIDTENKISELLLSARQTEVDIVQALRNNIGMD